MKTIRLVLAAFVCGLVSTGRADIGSVQYVQSVLTNVTGADVAMTGYEKAASAAAVAATDSVNEAVGKIEKALDGKQASGNYVAANDAITASGSTNKIVQYDAKGLVVAGTTAGGLATKDAVGSNEITDGSIVDADISSTAAIATSKIDGLDTALSSKVPTSRTVNSKALSSDITLSASDVGAVPTTTTVNSKALSGNITVNGADVALTGYAKADSASAVAAGDTINQAIGKIEKTLDGKQASGSYVPTTTTVNSKALSSDITLSASDVGAVPTTTTVNSKALSSNITLNGADVALTGYTKAASVAAVEATDTVNAAIGKIEKALDGKQASGSYVPTTTTVNSKALSGNIALDGADVALTGYAKPDSTSAVAATDTINAAIGKIEKALDDKVAANAAITASGTTNKIVQYDAKGLVVAGTTAGALATLSSVGSSEITDGSIVDADISSSAAIATSKISGLDTALSGKVPTTTTVNTKALSGNITLDGADIALTGYAKAESASVVAATDTINQAIGKIEKSLDGKQASGSYVETTTTVNGHALSSNVTVSKSDVGLGNVANVDTTDAANISTGTLGYARLPVGTAASTVAAGDDARFNTVATSQPSGTPPTGTVFVWFE